MPKEIIHCEENECPEQKRSLRARSPATSPQYEIVTAQTFTVLRCSWAFGRLKSLTYFNQRRPQKKLHGIFTTL